MWHTVDAIHVQEMGDGHFTHEYESVSVLSDELT